MDAVKEIPIAPKEEEDKKDEQDEDKKSASGEEEKSRDSQFSFQNYSNKGPKESDLGSPSNMKNPRKQS